MERTNFRRFEVRRGYRQSLPVLIISSVMIIIGLVLVIFGLTGPGLALAAMGLLFMLLILPQVSAAGRGYGIGDEGLFLKRLTAELVIPYSDIESAALLNGREAKLFMEELFGSSVESERNLDLSGWYRSNKKIGEITRWMSAPLSGTEIRKGGPVNITSYTVNPGGGQLLLRLKDGRRFLVSPLDVNAFYTEILKRGIPGVPVTEGEGESLQNVDTMGAGRRTGRIIRTVSRIVFVIILALVGYFVVYPALKSSPGKSQDGSGTEAAAPTEQQVPPESVAGWVDDDTFVFTVDRQLLPEMERDGTLTALIYSDYAAPRMLRLLESEGAVPEGASGNPVFESYLGDFMMLHTILRFVYMETAADGTEMNVYTVEASDLKNFIGPLITNSAK